MRLAPKASPVRCAEQRGGIAVENYPGQDRGNEQVRVKSHQDEVTVEEAMGRWIKDDLGV